MIKLSKESQEYMEKAWKDPSISIFDMADHEGVDHGTIKARAKNHPEWGPKAQSDKKGQKTRAITNYKVLGKPRKIYPSELKAKTSEAAAELRQSRKDLLYDVRIDKIPTGAKYTLPPLPSLMTEEERMKYELARALVEAARRSEEEASAV
jgi:hypothetical protein